MAIGGALLGIILAFAMPVVIWGTWPSFTPSFTMICTVSLGIYGLLGGVVMGLRMAHKMNKMVIQPPPPPKNKEA